MGESWLTPLRLAGASPPWLVGADAPPVVGLSALRASGCWLGGADAPLVVGSHGMGDGEVAYGLRNGL